MRHGLELFKLSFISFSLARAGVVVIQKYEPFVIPCKSLRWQQTNFVGER